MEIRNYGLNIAPITEQHWAFGDIDNKVILQPNGDWTPYLPEFVPQSIANVFETSGCTTYATTNALEMIIYRLTGVRTKYAERFLYILAGVTQAGGDPQVVAEAARNKGMIDYGILPFPATYKEFNSPVPMTDDLLSKGADWVSKYKLNHGWLWTVNTQPSVDQRKAIIANALPYGTVTLTVCAWAPKPDGTYGDFGPGQNNNHDVCCIKIVENGYLIRDSYEKDGKDDKIVAFDHNIQFAKGFTITAQTEPAVSQNKYLAMLYQYVYLLIQKLKSLTK